MMPQMAAEQVWGDPHRLDHLTVAPAHPHAVTALLAGHGKATITAQIAVQPFTDRGLKLPGAHAVSDSRRVFGGPLTQITPLASSQTKARNPRAVSGRRPRRWRRRSAPPMPTSQGAAPPLWKVHKAPESIDDLTAPLIDDGFEFTSRPQRIAHFTAFLTASARSRPRSPTGRSCSGAHHQNGD